MKQTLAILLAAGVGFAVAALWFSQRQTAQPGGNTTAQPASAEAKSRADEGVARQLPPRRVTPATAPVTTEKTSPGVARRTPQELLNELAAIQVTPGPGQARAQYRILALLDQLAQSGSAALPAIREFLAANRDVAYASAGRVSGRTGAGNAMLPPSLRMGLFDVVRQMGGVEGEQVLAENLTTTGRSAELGYLSQLLEELSPGKYREATLTAARNLLAGGKITDPSERNGLYDLLLQLKDTSFVGNAQAGLVQGDGKVDRSALRFLQQALGEKSLAVAAQAFQDARVVDAESKEALGRLALSFVGANDQALELYHKAALDPQLTPDQRRNLIEDLNEDGLSNRRNPTPEDLKVIANRYALTQTYLQQDYVKNDRVLNESFREADKDLRNLLERAGAAPAPNPSPK